MRKRSLVRIHVRPPVICRDSLLPPRSAAARPQPKGVRTYGTRWGSWGLAVTGAATLLDGDLPPRGRQGRSRRHVAMLRSMRITLAILVAAHLPAVVMGIKFGSVGEATNRLRGYFR